MRTKRVFTPGDEVELMLALTQWRQVCIAALAKAPIQSPQYRATSKAIDGINEAMVILADNPAINGPGKY